MKNCVFCGKSNDEEHRCTSYTTRSVDEKRDPSRLFNPARSMIFCHEERRGNVIIQRWERWKDESQTRTEEG